MGLQGRMGLNARRYLSFGARDGVRTTLHFGITDGLIRIRKGTHLRTSSDQRGKERVDQTSGPPGPDNHPKRPCGTPWRTRPLTTVMSGTGRITDNGLRITGLTEERYENDWNRTEPGVGDRTRLSGGESFCLCVCLGGTSRRELVIN